MEIKLCMGSSCFARGNANNLEYIENYVSKNKLKSNIELLGCRCEECCNLGPNVTINGKKYNKVTIEKIKKVLAKIEKRAK